MTAKDIEGDGLGKLFVSSLASGPLNGIMVFSGILSMMIPLLVITTIKTEGFMKKSFFIRDLSGF